MKANELINSVFTKLGNPLPLEVQTKMANAINIDVDDAIANKFNTDYFTHESALQNPEIRSKIKAEILNGTDAEIERLMGKFEFDDAAKADVKKVDKTSKRLEALTDKIKELTEAKAGQTKVTKDALSKEIEKLNEQIVNIKTDYENKLQSEKVARKTDKINWELDGLYKGFEYALAAEKNISVTMAKALIEKINADKGLKFDISEQGIKIMTKDNTEYFENNVKVTPEDYIKKNLMDNKLLKVAPNTNNNGNAARNTTQANVTNQDWKAQTEFQRVLSQRIAEDQV
jgi:hypothetical protein